MAKGNSASARQPGAKVLLRQVRSVIGRSREFRSSVCALGLGRIGDEQEHTLNPAVWGAINKIRHIVTISEVK